ncbi:PEP-CTERM sorting domain-containing protein [Paucibacter sp. Y2R2-4]|uniref:PEP-CTERM sorting domain-containing protein n=1 Tax=Paucibacter sp. Y2R2-4 TaxID=2893553 RepID=UPI0021E47473|nr:PEP-CTERM sorting domain-containing protein [Paucibacter sp. Y2R2-4]MCV2349483.1 PEP-CTERM sorting domain-containing protein [Paucibacter sp. Y2R2-4]
MSTAASANPQLLKVVVTVDKPSYNATYSLGVEANVTSDLPLVSVTADHQGSSTNSFGSWALTDKVAYWHAYSPLSNYFPKDTGPVDGMLNVRATDTAGQRAEVSVRFQPSEEMEMPEVQYVWTGLGFSISGQAVSKADNYNLWVWDPLNQSYVYSATSTQADQLSFIDGALLTPGHGYRVFFIANNYVTNVAENYTLLYRSYSGFDLSVAAAVPEPSSYALLLGGLGVVGLIGRHQSVRVQRE